jgi:general secretion pathway protein E
MIAADSDYLVIKGLVSEEDYRRAKEVSAQTGDTLPRVLVRLGLIASADLADRQAKFLSVPRVHAEDFPSLAINGSALQPTFLRSQRLCPIAISPKEGMLTVATSDPGNKFVTRALSFAMEKPWSFSVATEDDISAAVDRLYFPQQNNEDAYSTELMSNDLERLKELASDAPVVTYVDGLIEQAIRDGASDIHIEPRNLGFRVRLRVHGVLNETSAPLETTGPAVVSRIKIMAGMDIAERRLAQDGRIRHQSHGRQVDFRVSTSPTSNGESIVLRLLDRGHVSLDFPSLGFDKRSCLQLEELIQRPDGIVLVTGPTGSGKTTSLYAALNILNRTECKILSVEDPVEYTFDGVSQVQVDANIGRTFASTLRSFLRQDPDIIMVGEIRDSETASISVQAALTGHLVLSTLHTNSAAAAVTRLLDMGVESYLIASTLRAVVAQRLVRTLCSDCRTPWKIDATLARTLKIPTGTQFFHAGKSDCDACDGKAYVGRTVIAEILPISETIRGLILSNSESVAIHRAAEKEGMASLLSNGVQKALTGVTTLEEVLRVTEER